MKTHWRHGDHVILRDPLETRATRTYTAITGDATPNLPGWPYVVIEDSDEFTTLLLPEGTKLWRWDIVQQRFREPRITQGYSLRLLFRGKRYHVDLFFESGSGPAPWVQYLFLGGASTRQGLIGDGGIPADPRGRVLAKGGFYGWKVDIISPFLRTDLGFDVTDEVLDIVVRPDRSYVLKDLDQLECLVAKGIYTPTEADRIFETARGVGVLIEAGLPPFDDHWKSWLPPPDLGVPEAPAGWQFLPLADSEWGAIHEEMRSRR